MHPLSDRMKNKSYTEVKPESQDTAVQAGELKCHKPASNSRRLEREQHNHFTAIKYSNLC